jgi:hypothetical protein
MLAWHLPFVGGVAYRRTYAGLRSRIVLRSSQSILARVCHGYLDGITPSRRAAPSIPTTAPLSHTRLPTPVRCRTSRKGPAFIIYWRDRSITHKSMNLLAGSFVVPSDRLLRATGAAVDSVGPHMTPADPLIPPVRRAAGYRIRRRYVMDKVGDCSSDSR